MATKASPYPVEHIEDVRTELRRYNWQPQPEAQRILDDLLAEFLNRNAWAKNLARRMKDDSGTRFKDWVDHYSIAASDPLFVDLRDRLLAAGFTHTPQPGAANSFIHKGGLFPEVLLGAHPSTRVAIKVDRVADFIQAHQLHDARVFGKPLGQMRLACVAPATNAELYVIERHGIRGYDCPEANPTPTDKCMKAQEHLERLCWRRREFASDFDGLTHLNTLLDNAIADVGRDWTCDLFFESERRYWMHRNRASQVQYVRQRRLGLGWANHDHHTYRCSRHCFTQSIATWEKLGFFLRERFYAGAEAGWGAQVCEQPVTGIITFNDVDMSPEELLFDFSHGGFKEERGNLGTVGVWCALHGEALLQAGMHHLECQFDWQALVDQLQAEGNVKHMDPFTTFPYLKQAFTEGERWPVREERIQKLLQSKMIDEKQAELFRKEGALGSHLENLERNDGFKGFNQQGVSDIIARTDARRMAKLDANKKLPLGA